jgi:hypothetical protein
MSRDDGGAGNDGLGCWITFGAGVDANATGLLGVNGCGSASAGCGNAKRNELPSSGIATFGSFEATTGRAGGLTGGAGGALVGDPVVDFCSVPLGDAQARLPSAEGISASTEACATAAGGAAPLCDTGSGSP